MNTNKTSLVLIVFLLLLSACSKKVDVVPPVTPTLPQSVRAWEPVITRLEKDGFDRKELIALFSQPQFTFDPKPMRTKLKELYKLGYASKDTKKIQQGLLEMGFKPGKPDGLAGPNTRRAIKAYQEAVGMPKHARDGKPSKELLTRIETDLLLPVDKRPKPKPAKIAKSGTSSKTGKPGKKATAPVYKSVFTKKQLAASKAFYNEHLPLLKSMEHAYGVPAELAVAIFTVETRLGTYLGKEPAVVSLASMALCADLSRIEPYLTDMTLDADTRDFLAAKARKRGDWAYKELYALLTYAARNDLPPLDFPGSVYGAIGLGQFMPSNVLAYGVDGNNDVTVNLFDLEDAVYSFGNFMRAMGWEGDMSDEKKQRKVVMRYNRSAIYVNSVLKLANYLRQNPSVY